MTIRFICKCGKKLKASDEYAGKRTKCPACGTALQIPGSKTLEMSAATKSTNTVFEQCTNCGGNFPRGKLIDRQGKIICNHCFDESIERSAKIKKLVIFSGAAAIITAFICITSVIFFFDLEKPHKNTNNTASSIGSTEKIKSTPNDTTAESSIDPEDKISIEPILAESAPQENQDIEGNDFNEPEQVSFEKELDIQNILENANNGDCEAQYLLGIAYDIGQMNKSETNSENNKKQAIYWWKKAAEQGHIRAQRTLGIIYFSHLGTSTVDYEQSFTWFTQAAKQGDSEAQYYLGVHYDYGYGAPKDNNESFKWYKKAAEKGHSDAEYEAAMKYYNLHDYTKAAKLYKRAADKGQKSAQYKLAEVYHDGKGISQDYNEAINWYTRAANARLEIVPIHNKSAFLYVSEGNTAAYYALEQIYRNGEGVKVDNNEAFKWCMKAAEKGHKEAQLDLGNMYYNGNGTEKDCIEAYKWYTLSGNQGCTDAFEARNKIKTEMTSEKISEAEKRTGTFKISENKYHGFIFSFFGRPGEFKTKIYRELTEEEIAKAQKNGISIPHLSIDLPIEFPKYDIPKIPTFVPPKIDTPKFPTYEPVKIDIPKPPTFTTPRIEPPYVPQIEPSTRPSRSHGTPPPKLTPRDSRTQSNEFSISDDIELIPEFKEELIGANKVHIQNPNNFLVTVGLRSGSRGRNFIVPADGTRTINVPDGKYDIYFIYSNKPGKSFKGRSFSLNNNGVEIQILKSASSRYGIIRVKD